MDSSILLNIQDQVAYIKFNRPKKFNSFNREMAFNLQKTLTIASGMMRLEL